MHEKIVILDDMKKCTGCGTCANVCAANAIVMKEGYHTFVYPEIDENKCVKCHQCQSVCPVNIFENNNSNLPELFAVEANDDIRRNSSSGGCFFVFSSYIINNGGCVFTTLLDDNLKVHFTKINDIKEIARCQGSMYVQSDTGLIFREVKKELDSGKLVSFFGCPCQVAGLKNYLKHDYERLYTIDLLCHGVPSYAIFNKYLKEKNIENIKKVNFRDKKYGWRTDMIAISYANGDMYVNSWKSGDAYEIAFQSNMSLRDSCERCKFCDFPRVGDISIGDFWGAEKFISIDGKGTSLVFVNNNKGKFFIEKVKDDFARYEKMDINFSSIKNRIHNLYQHHPNKHLFFSLLKNNTFSSAVNVAQKGMYDVGIVGIPTVENFGGALSYFALFSVVKKLGYNCVLIERPNDCIHPPANIGTIYHHSPYENGDIISNTARREDLNKLNYKIEKFLVGSDQLYHNNLMRNFSNFALLDWVFDNKIKLAYAASFGHSEFTGNEEMRALMAYYLQKFDRFSVRESTSVSLAKKDFGVDAVQVLDPVFLCDPKVYLDLLKEIDVSNRDEYIGAYILDPNPNKERLLRNLSRKLGLPLKIYSEMFYTKTTVKDKWNLDIEIGKIEDRIANIYNSKYFITDSFHGMCLAIIFKKNFVAIQNSGRGTARFLSLLQQLNLSDHLFLETDDVDRFPKINYSSVNTLLKREIEQSLTWLSDSLSWSKKKPFSTEDIVLEKLRKENENLRFQLNDIRRILGVQYINTSDIYEYIFRINSIKNKLLIVISAKDTPGMSISDKLYSQLKMLGLKSSLNHAHWCGYIAVIFRGVVIYENCEYQKKIEYKMQIQELDLNVISAPLHCGNDSSTIINGNEYSAKSRGLNFVVYDFDKKQVTDSVGFDTHHRLLTATRKDIN